MKRIALSFVLLAGLALCAQPWAWPARHTHVEVETAYSSQDLHQVKQWYYDFTDLKLRVDAKPFESAVAGTYFGLQSFWLNNTLTMITSVAGLPFCVQLDMPFGMMTPDWFLGPDAVVLTPLTNTRAYRPKYEQVYTVTGWHRMNAGVGYFDYFFDNSTGSPYRMSAPGPSPSGSGSFANIQNEYYDFSIVPSFPQGTFAWPSNVNCTVGAGMKFVPETFAEILAAVPQPRGLPAEHHNYLARHLHHLLSYPRRV